MKEVQSTSGKISIMAICIFLGIMLAIQFNTSSSYDVNLRGTSSDEMAYKIITIAKERDTYAEELIGLRQKLSNLETGSSQTTADMQSELQKSNIAAGLTTVEGPGIVVTVNDSPNKVQFDVDPDVYLVHDRNIRDIISEMRASGAEAIAVNDQRITALSEIRCAGTTILINQTRLTPPYVIKAIGNPKNLESGLLIRGGIISQLSNFLQTKLENTDKTQIPAYNGVLKFDYCTPVALK